MARIAPSRLEFPSQPVASSLEATPAEKNLAQLKQFLPEAASLVELTVWEMGPAQHRKRPTRAQARLEARHRRSSSQHSDEYINWIDTLAGSVSPTQQYNHDAQALSAYVQYHSGSATYVVTARGAVTDEEVHEQQKGMILAEMIRTRVEEEYAQYSGEQQRGSTNVAKRFRRGVHRVLGSSAVRDGYIDFLSTLVAQKVMHSGVLTPAARHALTAHTEQLSAASSRSRAQVRQHFLNTHNTGATSIEQGAQRTHIAHTARSAATNRVTGHFFAQRATVRNLQHEQQKLERERAAWERAESDAQFHMTEEDRVKLLHLLAEYPDEPRGTASVAATNRVGNTPPTSTELSVTPGMLAPEEEARAAAVLPTHSSVVEKSGSSSQEPASASRKSQGRHRRPRASTRSSALIRRVTTRAA